VIDVAEAWLTVVLLQHINHERNAPIHGIARFGATDIGLNPALCDNEFGAEIIGTMSRMAFHKHIVRRLGLGIRCCQ
jgi:hypothetical protein